MNKLVIGLILAIAVLAIIVAFFTVSKRSSQVTISGSLDLNGQPPTGSTITFMQRPVGQGNFTPFLSSQTPLDSMKWSWTGAVANTNYEIQAVITQGSQTLDTSNTLLVTAPATGSIIRLNYNDLDATKTPAASPSSSPTPTPTPQTAVISGTLDINGYIPQNSTITLQQAPFGTSNYQPIGNSFPATDGGSWAWNQAVQNQEYSLQAVLTTSSGTQIGSSQPLAVSAPATNEILTINSTASQPTPQTTAISGTLAVNGVMPGGGSVVILQTTPGQNQYQTIISSLNPSSGTAWSWTAASAGTQYQIAAALKDSNGNVVAVSPAILVTAPAANEVLTLNSNYSLPAPQNLPSITCGTKNSANNSWSATINYNTIPGAQTYWLQLGTTSNANNLVNTTQGSNNSTYVTVNATLTDSVTYYAQYAYSMSPNVSMGSNFSPFSPSQPVMCN